MTGFTSTLVIRSTWGSITVHAADGMLLRCVLPVADSSRLPSLRRQGEECDAMNRRDKEVLQRAADYVRACFGGRNAVCPPLVRQPGTIFFDRIMQVLRRVPPGSRITYGELAAKSGYAGAARAAGTACAANRLPLFIPCHRVVGAGGRIGGFSSGAAWKNHLLLVESAAGGFRACA